MNESDFSEQRSLMLVRVAEATPATYSIETATRLADVHPDMHRHDCRLGLFGEARATVETDPNFDDDALYELRRFEHHRWPHGLNRRTLRRRCELWREPERRRAELSFLLGA